MSSPVATAPTAAPMSTDRKRPLLLVAGVFLLGLMAGVFFAFACAVMPGLSGSTDRTMVEGMQKINAAIENPLFLLAFAGALLLPAIVLYQERKGDRSELRRFLIAAVALYAVALLITFAVDIPLNEELKDAGNPAHIHDLATVRDNFVGPWVAGNIARTVATAAAFACAAWALVVGERE